MVAPTNGPSSLEGIISIGLVLFLAQSREMKCFTFNLGGCVCIIDAEIYYILKAIHTISNLRFQRQRFPLIESQISLKRLKLSPNHFSNLIRTIVTKIALHLKWYPCHIGIEGIEISNALASKGLSLPISKQDCYTTHAYFKKLV